ncbi:hemin uptake protein HemP [Roseobacter sp. WL0113]|uniref:Hemin uptake protein HemP n=2 Tax=Roseobacter sinensis TaxID=2931391 RepID=A0ABT3BI97_9RHOB|nr:hemin uptake protein HemP [Roseobacter sp. WL0113]MCV3272849.1 hemin uptake protein HemP [Roseobacter sp. WL0113]
MAQPTRMDPGDSAAADIVTYDVRDLIVSGVQARLVLDGQPYFLRITRAGKLILTK